MEIVELKLWNEKGGYCTVFVMENVVVEAPESISEEEARVYVKEELSLWHSKGRVLGQVTLAVEGEDVVIAAIERSPIKRIRRITGYLSEQNNFNDAKQSELRERIVHVS